MLIEVCSWVDIFGRRCAGAAWKITTAREEQRRYRCEDDESGVHREFDAMAGFAADVDVAGRG